MYECFATAILEFEDVDRKSFSKNVPTRPCLKYRITSKRSLFYNNRIVFLERNVKCYERRKKCYERFGWCYADDTWGFCNEINYLPDEPDDEDPLFEVPTIIWPKEVIFLDI